VGPNDFMKQVVPCLNDAGTRYFVTGSMASMNYGEVRSTVDLDIVVDLRYSDANMLTEHFALPHWYLDRKAMLNAMQDCTSFNVIDNESIYKIDFMVVDASGYNKVRFDRVRARTVGGVPVKMSAPEDVILMKLKFHQEGGSDKHLRDIASMFKVSGDEIDRLYLEKWAAELGIAEELTKVRASVRW
jgi:predicted nucleotidyltransferase